MRISCAARSRAFTLIEVLIASVIAAMILALSIHFMMAGLGVHTRCLTQGTIQDQARQGIETIIRELKDSGEGCTGWAVGINPNPASQFYDQDVTRVGFSRCVGYDPAQDLLLWGPVVSYSFQPAQGAEPGKLVRTESGVPTLVCDRVVDFHVRFLPMTAKFQVTLTVQCPDPESPGHFIRASYQSSVKLRNA